MSNQQEMMLKNILGIMQGYAGNKRLMEIGKGEWSVIQEREFTEKLFYNRFHYFLLVYTLFLTASAMSHVQNVTLFLLFTGIVVLVITWIPMIKAYIRLVIIFAIIREFPDTEEKREEKNVFRMLDRGLRGHTNPIRNIRVNKLVAYLLPAVCILSLVVWIVMIIV